MNGRDRAARSGIVNNTRFRDSDGLLFSGSGTAEKINES